MFKTPYELWIGSRYAGLTRSRGRGKRRDGFVSFVAGSSMAGIALGVAALIVVMSVMNGFQVQVRDRMLSVIPHIQVFQADVDAVTGLEKWQEIAAIAQQNPHVIGASAFVSSSGMLSRGDTLRGVEIRGIDPLNEHQVSDLPKQMIAGELASLEKGSFNIVLGRYLANMLGAYVGDTVLLMSPQGSINPSGFAPRMRQFTVSGIFSSDHYEYDSSMAFISVDDAAILFRDKGLAGARLRIKDMLQAQTVADELLVSMPAGLVVRDWTQDNRTWFAAVKTEKRMMFLILTLIVAVAAFNLLSSLVMAVKDKQSDIAILRTLGVSPLSIAKIFLVQGSLIGIIGTFLGVVLGCLIAYHIDVIIPAIEGLFGVQFLDPSIYFITQLPSEPVPHDILVVAVVSLVLSLLATLYPSIRASRLQPAEVLRHD
ncbi:lipoprotein-releasing system transmembrane subunit LolC [Oligella urethralis]|uniref:lipoprotein-releasing ABC transporter permease subunit n=1 Tax=Oligella urethralis TaxID=90245 RepID=UPI000C9B5075|nr:lipoprotein-releasing ABC transporter permease subunit [Oligella urethralis]PMC16720.1 lipoprotein-releasing system transmembrane subunit LolC [Oligella urethralis]